MSIDEKNCTACDHKCPGIPASKINWKLQQLYPSKQTKVGHFRPACETTLKWRFAGGPIAALDCILAGL